MPLDDYVEHQETEQEPKPEPSELELLRSKVQELEQAAQKVKELEQELASLKSPRQAQEQPKPEPTADVHAELAKLKLSTYLANDPHAARFKEEIEAALASVAPELRISDFTIQSAIAYVKGRHVDDIVASIAKQPPAPVDSASAAPEPPKPEPPKLQLSEPQKSVLSAWFDGNIDAAISIIEEHTS